MILTNKNEKLVVKQLNQKLKVLIEKCPEQEISFTFIPYYDSILDESKKFQLGEVRLDDRIVDKVRRQTSQSIVKKDNTNS